MKKINFAVSLIFMIIYVLMSVTQAQSPQKTLNQYISDLQTNPNDTVLREKIIKLVQTMKRAPAIPVDAEKYEGRAEFAFKNAKSDADFLDAAKEYEKALLVAPWAPAYYFNQGVAYEKAGKLKESKQSFEFYLLAVPDAKDAREVRKRIAGLEYAIEKAVKEPIQTIVVEKKQESFEDLLKKLDGRRYIFHPSRYTGVKPVIDVTGKFFVLGVIYDAGSDAARSAGAGYHENHGRPYNHLEIRGRESTYPWTGYPYDEQPLSFQPLEEIFIISEDGNKITFCTRYKDGHADETIYTYQGSVN